MNPDDFRRTAEAQGNESASYSGGKDHLRFSSAKAVDAVFKFFPVPGRGFDCAEKGKADLSAVSVSAEDQINVMQLFRAEGLGYGVRIVGEKAAEFVFRSSFVATPARTQKNNSAFKTPVRKNDFIAVIFG